MTSSLNKILRELKAHAPFTVLGTSSGVLVLLLIVWARVPRSVSTGLFWTLHPLHVVLSALVTTAMFRLHGGRGFWRLLGVGYFGSIGIATLSDCLLPYAGEWLLALPHRGLHLGFIEKWWLVNPLALAGITAGFAWPHTKFPHAGHVLLSTWASLFHITMALGDGLSLVYGLLIGLFLFLSVWLPCCTSDIIFQLLFAPKAKSLLRGEIETVPTRRGDLLSHQRDLVRSCGRLLIPAPKGDEINPRIAVNSENKISLVFVCSGAADVGELTDRAARHLQQRGLAAMSCTASVGARDQDIMFNADLAERVLLIDACPENCSRRTFELAGIHHFAHFDLSQLGFVKGASPVTDKRIQAVVNHAIAVLGL